MEKKEAMKILKDFHDKSALFSVRTALDTIIPELRDNEDERIRKNCIHFLELQKQHHAATFEIEECISWLEKQGEQTYVKWSYDEGKQIQINPSEYINDMGGNGCYLKNTAQASAWSEEDEKIYNRICGLIHSAAYMNYEVDEDGSECGEYANIKGWFNKLKDRVQSQSEQGFKKLKDSIQPEQKWSEDDERIYKSITYSSAHNYPLTVQQQEFVKSLKGRVQPQNLTVTDEELAQAKKDAYNDILDKLEYNSENPTFDDGWSAAIWYLKKRNAQFNNTWTPSDEQMEAIRYVTNFDYGGHKATLVSLYEQLKKLKG